LPRDKALDAAEIGKGALDEGARFPALHDREVREPGICGCSMIAARLLGSGEAGRELCSLSQTAAAPAPAATAPTRSSCSMASRV